MCVCTGGGRDVFFGHNRSLALISSSRRHAREGEAIDADTQNYTHSSLVLSAAV